MAVTKALVAPASIVFLKAFAVVGKSIDGVVPATKAIPALLTDRPAMESSPLPPSRVENNSVFPLGFSLVTKPSLQGRELGPWPQVPVDPRWKAPGVVGNPAVPAVPATYTLRDASTNNGCARRSAAST